MRQGEGSVTHFQLLFTGVFGEDMEELQTLLLNARFWSSLNGGVEGVLHCGTKVFLWVCGGRTWMSLRCSFSLLDSSIYQWRSARWQIKVFSLESSPRSSVGSCQNGYPVFRSPWCKQKSGLRPEVQTRPLHLHVYSHRVWWMRCCFTLTLTQWLGPGSQYVMQYFFLHAIFRIFKEHDFT
jgi:hypothetical protein